MRKRQGGSQTTDDRVRETEGEKRREGVRQKYEKERKLEAEKYRERERQKKLSKSEKGKTDRRQNDPFLYLYSTLNFLSKIF